MSWLGLGRLERHELNWLVVGFGACVLLFVFVRLAGEVTEGETQAFDTRIMRALRSPADPSKPLGPRWMENALLDLTALGGSTVLGLVVLSVVGFLLLQTRYRTALVVAMTAISAEVLNAATQGGLQPSPPVDRAVTAGGVFDQLSERPCDGIGDRLPDARRDPDARGGVAG